jgi:hypothetical protein
VHIASTGFPGHLSGYRFSVKPRDMSSGNEADKELTLVDFFYGNEILDHLSISSIRQAILQKNTGGGNSIDHCNLRLRCHLRIFDHPVLSLTNQEKRYLTIDMDAWTNSVERLMSLVSTKEIEIIGRPSSGGATEPIDGHVIADISVSHPLRVSFSTIVGDDPWISCTPYIDEEHWKAYFNDELFLFRSGSARWTHLQVKKADVLREIRFQESAPQKAHVYKTGAPGRPTSMQLVRLEFDARNQRGETAPSITLEAVALAEWLIRTHRDAPPLKPKTIKNNLAEAYRHLVGARK